MRKQTIFHFVLSAGLFSACAPQGGGDPGANPARSAAQPEVTAGQVTTVIPGDIVAGVVVSDIVNTCATGPLPAVTDRALAVGPQHPDVVYVGVAGKGLFRSINGGLGWQPLVRGLRAHFADDSRSLCFDHFSQIAVDPRDANHLCVAVRGEPGLASTPVAAAAGVFCSSDGGNTFDSMLPPSISTAVDAIAIDPRHGDNLVAAFREPWQDETRTGPVVAGALAVSSDRGVSWARRDPLGAPVTGMTATDLTIADANLSPVMVAMPVVNETLPSPYEAPQSGLLSSRDLGNTWKTATSGMLTRMSSRAIRRVAVAPRDPSHLIVVTGADKGHGGPYVYFSRDGGETFVVPAGAQNLTVDLVAFDPGDPSGQHALAIDVDHGRTFETADGGATWTTVGVNLPLDTYQGPVRLSQLLWTSDARVLYLSGSHGTVYRSVDGGTSWVRVLMANVLPAIE